MNSHYDVVIVGGGIAGVSSAFELAGRGHDVAVVERESTLTAHSTGRSAAQFLASCGEHWTFCCPIPGLVRRGGQPAAECCGRFWTPMPTVSHSDVLLPRSACGPFAERSSPSARATSAKHGRSSSPPTRPSTSSLKASASCWGLRLMNTSIVPATPVREKSMWPPGSKRSIRRPRGSGLLLVRRPRRHGNPDLAGHCKAHGQPDRRRGARRRLGRPRSATWLGALFHHWVARGLACMNCTARPRNHSDLPIEG